MFGLFKKKEYKLLTPDMLEPVDKDVTTQEAKSVFKQYLLQVKYCDRGTAAELARDFGEDMKEHMHMLREDLDDAKTDLKEEKANLKKLKSQLSKASEGEREELKDEVEYGEGEIEVFEEEVKLRQAEVNNFKRDKRRFVVESVNSYLQR